MSSLPEGWVATKLTEVCTLNPAKPKSDRIVSDLPVTFVPMAAVDAELGTIANPSIREYSAVAKGFTSFQENDVIMAKITPCMENGKAAIARRLSNGIGFGSTEFHVFRPSAAVLPEYVFHFIRQESFRKSAEANMTGSVGQKRVPASFLNEYDFPLPPLAEQRRIVAKLNPLIGSIDTYQQRFAKIPMVLKRFRQAVLAAACAGRLTAKWREDHECSEWETKPLGELITDPKNGYSSNPVGYNTAYRVLTLTATTSGKFKPEHFKYFDEHIPTDSPLWLRPGDILVQRGNTIEYVGVSAIYDGGPNQFIYPDLMIKFRAKDAINTKFLHIMLSWERTRNYFRENATGTAGNMPKINQKVLAATPIEVPSKPEQQEIVRHVEALFKLVDQIEARYQRAKPMVDKLPQSILAKAFRGELVPTEAELARREGRDYEPASVLLERIRSERAEHAQGRKGKAGSQLKPIKGKVPGVAISKS